MKILIINRFHHKNRSGIERILKNTNYQYCFTNSLDNIENFDIIYVSDEPIDTSKHPTKKFLFGPHFSVLPNNKLNMINNVHNNCIYLQPSEWCVNLWKMYGVTKFLPIEKFPFPVDTDYFCSSNQMRTEVFLYHKRRDPKELQYLKLFLETKKIQYKFFDYNIKYNEKDYLDTLQKSKYGIILDAHESQGFAIEEALSCNVPLLVWNVKTLNQEYRCNYPHVPATSIGYWDRRCGEFFYEAQELETTFVKFLQNLHYYKPREFIMENLSLEPCTKNFVSLINSLNVQ